MIGFPSGIQWAAEAVGSRRIPAANDQKSHHMPAADPSAHKIGRPQLLCSPELKRQPFFR